MPKVWPLLLCLMFLHFSSCADLPSKRPMTEEQKLASRAELFWESFTTRDWDAVETLVDPQKREELSSYLESLRESKPMAQYLEYTRKDLDIGKKKAQVTYEATIKYLHPFLQNFPPQEQRFCHAWVKRDGQWYIILHEPRNMKSFLESLKNNS